MARIDYDRVAAAYERGRTIDLEGLEDWRQAVAPYLGECDRVLDVGSGTGLFAEAFALWFDVHVIGIEPSAGMRREASRLRRHRRVSYVGGQAERLPLRAASCDAAWLSTVIHHIGNLAACAGEMRRVLRQRGVVLIRSAFPDHPLDVTSMRYFPSARKVLETFPYVAGTTQTFAGAGFATVALASVRQVSAPGLRAYADRVRERADTLLLGVPDDEFAAGLAALDRDAAAEREPVPVVNRLSLLVLRRMA